MGGCAVGPAAGPVAGSQPGHLEPGVVFKQLNEALADHSGRAQNSDWKFGSDGHEHSSVQEYGHFAARSAPVAWGIRTWNLLLPWFKGQPMIERRFEQLKTGPRIAPLFLKNEGRMEVYFTLSSLAPLVEALIE